MVAHHDLNHRHFVPLSSSVSKGLGVCWKLAFKQMRPVLSLSMCVADISRACHPSTAARSATTASSMLARRRGVFLVQQGPEVRSV